MGTYSIGEALDLFLEKSHWKPKVFELRLYKEWEQIMAKTIAKYTRNVTLQNKKITIYTDVGPLKQELIVAKTQIITRINEYFDSLVVDEVIIK